MKKLNQVVALSLSLTLMGCGWFSKEPTRPDNAVVMGISYVGVTVHDLKSSVDLHQNVANLELVQQKTIENNPLLNELSSGNASIVSTSLLKGLNSQLRFMAFPQSVNSNEHKPVPVNGPGIAHVCYQVNKTTDTYQRFLEQGATHIGAKEMVQISSRNPVHYAYANDPEGITFEIEEVDVAALDLENPPASDFRIRQVALATPDMERLLAFYSILLQEQHPRRIGKWINLSGEKLDKISGLKDSELEMAWFQTRNLEVEIIQYHSHKPSTPVKPRPINAPGYNMIMFEVSDLAAAKEKLVEAGATIVAENQMLDEMPVIMARDPDGNLLGFQKTQSQNPLSAAQFANNGL